MDGSSKDQTTLAASGKKEYYICIVPLDGPHKTKAIIPSFGYGLPDGRVKASS
jgi:hypothetical protein